MENKELWSDADFQEFDEIFFSYEDKKASAWNWLFFSTFSEFYKFSRFVNCNWISDFSIFCCLLLQAAVLIEIINNKARHNLIDAKCRWRWEFWGTAWSNKSDAKPLEEDNKPPGHKATAAVLALSSGTSSVSRAASGRRRLPPIRVFWPRFYIRIILSHPPLNIKRDFWYT